MQYLADPYLKLYFDKHLLPHYQDCNKYNVYADLAIKLD